MIQEWILPDIEKSNAVTEDENDNGGMTDGKNHTKFDLTFLLSFAKFL